MSDKESPYTVGYGRPPREHRFKPGRSGNPAGRPKKVKLTLPVQKGYDVAQRPANQLLLEEAYRSVTVREGETLIELPAIQAVLRAMGVAAVKGNRGAQKLLVELVNNVEEEARQSKQELFEELIDYKLNGEQAMARYRRAGRTPPQMTPHPDDIHIDIRRGEAWVAGPMTPEEKATLDGLLKIRDEAQQQVSELAQRYARARKPATKQKRLDAWHQQQLFFDLANLQAPERYQRELKHRSYAAGAPQAEDAARVLTRWREGHGTRPQEACRCSFPCVFGKSQG